MRKYTLASSADRPNIDLRNYEAVITEAVHAFMPKASVRVERDCYYVSPTPTQGEAIKIGRQICQSDLMLLSHQQGNAGRLRCISKGKAFRHFFVAIKATFSALLP